MAVRFVIVERDGGNNARPPRIGDIDDRRSQMIRIGNVADKRMRTADRDLPAAGEIEMPQTADVASKAATGLAGYVHEKNSEDDGIGGGGAAPTPAGQGGGGGKAGVDPGVAFFPLEQMHPHAAPGAADSQ